MGKRHPAQAADTLSTFKPISKTLLHPQCANIPHCTTLCYPIIQLEPQNNQRRKIPLGKIERRWPSKVKPVVVAVQKCIRNQLNISAIAEIIAFNFQQTWVYIICEQLGQGTGKMVTECIQIVSILHARVFLEHTTVTVVYCVAGT